eukprot:1096360-Pleurochrysis_carterae.AAC.1
MKAQESRKQCYVTDIERLLEWSNSQEAMTTVCSAPRGPRCASSPNRLPGQYHISTSANKNHHSP